MIEIKKYITCIELRTEIDDFILTVFCILFEWRYSSGDVQKLMSIGDLHKQEFKTELKWRIGETLIIIKFDTQV